MSQAKTAAVAPELTVRSIIVGLLVAAVIGSAYPYCVLKLGFGPNLSVVSAFFGFIALVLILRATGTNAREKQYRADHGYQRRTDSLHVRAAGRV